MTDQPWDPASSLPTTAEVIVGMRILMQRLAALIGSYLPPWWVWVALMTGLILAGYLVRRCSLRALDVAPPTSAERARAAAAGRAIAASGPIGLVLGGGGAKGAYQVGCWKALRESGIVHFAGIAGTSVGALNAVLVAQDEFDRAERTWNEMSFGRVLRMRWWTLLIAIAIRVVLIVPYLGKFAFPARAIPVGLYRAIDEWQRAWGAGEPHLALIVVIRWYLSLLKNPFSTDMAGNFTLMLLTVSGAAWWWYLTLPLLQLVVTFLIAPFLALYVVQFGSWLAHALDLLATRLVLASNNPLSELVSECVNPERLKARLLPVFVTLGALREVQHGVVTPLVQSTAMKVPGAQMPPLITTKVDRDFGDLADDTSLPTPYSTMEYVPKHFNVCAEPPGRMQELILQSAGLPEIFPARRFDGVTYVDGGIADNEPLAALADISGHSTIIVIPLNSKGTEAKIRADLDRVLERLGRTLPTKLPELLVMTPSRPLGNMLFGTMDFAAERARAMMRLGYRDTIVRLAGQEEYAQPANPTTTPPSSVYFAR